LEDVKKMKRRKLVTRIENQNLHQEAGDVLAMMKEMDPKTLAFKFISLLLEEKDVQGPKEIGVEPRGYESKGRGNSYGKESHSKSRFSSHSGKKGHDVKNFQKRKATSHHSRFKDKV
jgi:ATP-dependent RNA helicase DeaD